MASENNADFRPVMQGADGFKASVPKVLCFVANQQAVSAHKAIDNLAPKFIRPTRQVRDAKGQSDFPFLASATVLRVGGRVSILKSRPV